MPSVDAHIQSHDFFAVLFVIRDLLLVAPPPDVKELAELALQEVSLLVYIYIHVACLNICLPCVFFKAKEELKRLHTLDEHDVPMEQPVRIADTGAVTNLRALHAFVQQIVSNRGWKSVSEVALQQTIAYEVLDFCGRVHLESKKKSKLTTRVPKRWVSRKWSCAKIIKR